MSDLVIYTNDYCPYCYRAMSLLESKGVTWDEINLDERPDRRMEMIQKADGRTSVPQIFLNGKSLGGFDEIALLDEKGQLDEILGIGRKDAI